MKKKQDKVVQSGFSFNRRTYYDLEYMLILPFDKSFANSITKDSKSKKILENTAVSLSKNKGIELLDISVTAQYIQLHIKAVPNMDISKYINSFKAVSSRYIRAISDQNFSVWKPTNMVCSLGDRKQMEEKLKVFLESIEA